MYKYIPSIDIRLMTVKLESIVKLHGQIFYVGIFCLFNNVAVDVPSTTIEYISVHNYIIYYHWTAYSYVARFHI